MAVRGVGLLLAVIVPGLAAAAPPPGFLDGPGPDLAPELLLTARIGGAGDQGFQTVTVGRGRVEASSRGMNVRFTLKDDGTFDVLPAGNPSAVQYDLGSGIKAFGMRRLGPLTYGYKQVHAILQQPYLCGPGWSWWGWSHGDCKPRHLMADSRCTYLAPMPNAHLVAFAKCDGGNTTLHRDPRDLDAKLAFALKHGGGKGTSSFVYEINPTDGAPVRQMILRGFANAACWDRWGRMMVVGRGITPGETHGFGYGDGAGLLLVDREWQRTLLSTHVGADGEGRGATFWGAAIDSETGLAAAVGWVEGEMRQVQPVQPRPGGGKDGLVVIFRLWRPAPKPESAQD